ncbi:uncharacterized protein y4hQ-like [Leptopilina heterotoma]|uniref:uncharacterized protein y4hQ-like n=1 Tax=Leptopilina heterotoma TaxID=63436 RepID=UPI001CA7FFC3|nr:uncharacterized protein y4hQ-like [Leptopilina heterotoma]
MSATEAKIYEFRIVLKDIKPTIWRQIQVPENYTFGHLSDAIISSMGWYGSHMHQFYVRNSLTGKREIIGEKPNSDDNFCVSTMWENDVEIKKYFVDNQKKALYIYDMGDGWVHDITLIKISIAEKNVNYPKCIDGKGACPPENCGGSSGYMQLLNLRKKKNLTTNEQEELNNYFMDGCNFDPEYFDPEKVIFLTPKLFNDCCTS